VVLGELRLFLVDSSILARDQLSVGPSGPLEPQCQNGAASEVRKCSVAGCSSLQLDNTADRVDLLVCIDLSVQVDMLPRISALNEYQLALI
jgi:hypothetical protein